MSNRTQAHPHTEHHVQSKDCEAVLVCAEEPLRSELAGLLVTRGYEPIVSTTPLQTVRSLLESGDRIGFALISSDLPPSWIMGICEYLADEYPAIRRAMLKS